jgi:hypothetical protein
VSTVPQTVPVPPELLLALVELVEVEYNDDQVDEPRRARVLLEAFGVVVEPREPYGMPRTSVELREILRGAAA